MRTRRAALLTPPSPTPALLQNVANSNHCHTSEKSPVTPIIATDPKMRSRKSCVCHTCDPLPPSSTWRMSGATCPTYSNWEGGENHTACRPPNLHAPIGSPCIYTVRSPPGRKNVPHANTDPNHGRFDPSDGGAGNLLRTSTAKSETLAGGALGRFLWARRRACDRPRCQGSLPASASRAQAGHFAAARQTNGRQLQRQAARISRRHGRREMRHEPQSSADRSQRSFYLEARLPSRSRSAVHHHALFFRDGYAGFPGACARSTNFESGGGTAGRVVRVARPLGGSGGAIQQNPGTKPECAGHPFPAGTRCAFQRRLRIRHAGGEKRIRAGADN